MSIMTPEEKLLAALFGCTAAQQAALDAEKLASDAAQTAKDWAEADRIAELANMDFPEHNWVAAIMYKWHACAVAITDDNKVLCAKPYGDSVGHSIMSAYDIDETEIKK